MNAIRAICLCSLMGNREKILLSLSLSLGGQIGGSVNVPAFLD